MAALEAWALLCRLFALGRPALELTLSPHERRAAIELKRWLRPAVLNQVDVLCPCCEQHHGELQSDRGNQQYCWCPDCGLVPYGPQDGAAVVVDDATFCRSLRRSLAIGSHDAINPITNDVWVLGEVRSQPVILARSLLRLWREPAVLNRVPARAGPLRVITPNSRLPHGSPFGKGIEWWPLEQRFLLRGGEISHLADCAEAEADHPAPWMPVNGPFSENFGWVTLPDEPNDPIELTSGQASVFRSLWSFKGKPVFADQVMQKAGLKSAKPIDLFKVKPRDRDRPESRRRLEAYHRLVNTDQRAGTYWINQDKYGSS